MKIAEVEIQADGKKATFFYIADDRVDFRELIKIFAGEFKVKVEMRQIGARQEAGKVGGIGSCGRELCCSTWLHDFKSVNTNAARYQNLSINQTKLSGQCGRLKCCLNYELDTYLDALQQFPTDAESLEITRGRAVLVKKDIFKNLMWYTLPDSNKQYPLTIKRVQEISALNRQGQRPDELQAVEVVSNKHKELEPEFVDVVGQISLRSLDKSTRRNRDRERSQHNQQQQRQQRPGQGSGNTQAQRPPNRQEQGRGRQPQPPSNPRSPQGGGNGGNQQRPPQNGGGNPNQRPPQGSGGGQNQRPPQGGGNNQRNRPPQPPRPSQKPPPPKD